MNLNNILTSLFALVFVLCLIGAASFLFKKYGSNLNISLAKNVKKRLQIKEILHIDAKKKIVLMAKDDKEFLIAFNEGSVELIEKDANEKTN